jgi:histone H3/H4
LIFKQYINKAYIHLKVTKLYTIKMANKLTQDAGLVFNVNTVKQHMIHFFETQDIYFEYKDKTSGETKRKLPMFSGSQTAMTAFIERLCTILVRQANKCTDKDKSGLRNVTRPRAKVAVLLDDSLSSVFSWKLRSFNRMQVYSDQLPVARKEFDRVCDAVDKNLRLTPRAHNLICFLLLEAYLEVLNTAYEMIAFAGRRTLDANAVLSAVRLRFPDNLSHELSTEMTRAVSAAGEEVTTPGNDEDKDENANEAHDEDSDVGEDAEETTTKGKKGGKGKTASTEAAAPAEGGDESAPKKGSGGGKGKGKTTTATSKKVEKIEDEDGEDEDAPAAGSAGEEDEDEVVAKPGKGKGAGKKTVTAPTEGGKTRKAAK